MMQILLSLLAGAATTLSPCVLPILPLVVSSALQKSKWGPVYLSLGMISSFTLFGVLIANIGPSLGITSDTIRTVSALIFILSSSVFLTKWGDRIFRKLMNPLAGKADRLASRADGSSVISMIAFGALLGAIWSPCSGPTLGVAIGLTLQEGSRLAGTLLFFIFGVGAAIPLIALSYGTRAYLMKKRGELISIGSRGKKILGLLILFLGISILLKWDKLLEAKILTLLPDWMIIVL